MAIYDNIPDEEQASKLDVDMADSKSYCTHKLHKIADKKILVRCDDAKAGTVPAKHAINIAKDYMPDIAFYARIELADYPAEHVLRSAIRSEVNQVKIEFPDDWDWQWVNNEGRLSKRLVKFIAETYAIPVKLVSKQRYVSDMCERMADYRFPEKIFYVQFVNHFDWNPGSFADRGSCFWGDRHYAKNMMKDAGFYAMRFWDLDERDGEPKIKGSARAWIAPDYPERGCFVAFNYYGSQRDIRYRLVAEKFGMEWVCVDSVSNNGTTCDTLYLNGDHYCFYPPNYTHYNRGVSHVDFEIDDPYGDDCDDDYVDDEDWG